jgi:tetratricopeptide (TPR) repeat protein
MQNNWQRFIAFALTMFMLTVANPLANSQEDIICKLDRVNPKAICLEERFIFRLENNKKVGDLTAEQRVREINARIKSLADNDSVKLDDLKIENWNGSKVTVIRSPTTVILTLSNDDVKAAKLPIEDKNKLASQYLERIKNEVNQYRKKHNFFNYFGWLKILNKNTRLKFPYWLAFLFILFLLVYIARFVYNSTLYKFPFFWNWMANNIRFAMNSFGRLLEFIVFIAIILFLIRLILIIFTANREAFFSVNITNTDLEKLFNQIYNILRIIGLIFLCGIISLILRWLSSQRNGTIVIPFVDLTTSDQEIEKVTSNNQKIGKAISNSLVSELNRIRHIQTLMKPEGEEHLKLQVINIPPLAPIQENLENNLSNIGTLEVGKARIPVGAILLGLRILWPFGGVNKVISGDIQKIGDKVRLVVRLEYQNEIMTWDVISDSMLTIEMIREIAYKVSIYLAPNITAKTWEGFKFFTEAIASYDKYRQTQNLQYLQQAYELCIEAKKFESKYEKLADLLYEIGVAFLEKQDYNMAQKVLDVSKQINPHNKYLYNALGNIYYANKEFLFAENEYNAALYLDKNFSHTYKFFAFFYENFSFLYPILSRIYPIFPYPYNGLGNVYYQKDYERSFEMYKKAIKFKKNFSRPYHNLANIYIYDKNKRDYKKACDNYEKSKKYSGNKLIMPYVGLSTAYLFRAVEDTNIQSRNNLLEKANLEIQRAISIKE